MTLTPEQREEIEKRHAKAQETLAAERDWVADFEDAHHHRAALLADNKELLEKIVALTAVIDSKEQILMDIEDKLEARLTTPPAPSAPLQEVTRATLDIILDWYKQLYEPARARLSFESLHSLAKQLDATRSVPSQWRPIETYDAAQHPRDVLVAGGEGNRRWSGEARWFADHEGWWTAGSDPTDAHDGQCFPTCWMPMPTPPAQEPKS